MKRLQIFLILCVFGLLVACTTDLVRPTPEVTFNDSVVGFSITKPSGWYFVSEETLEVNRDANRSNNAELEKISQENGDSPFLTVFARYPEPNSRNNPTVSVTVMHADMEGLPPKGVLNLSTAALKRAYPDLTIVEEIHDYEVDGILGAHTKLKFTVTGADKQPLRTMHRMWLVLRGKTMFSIAMTGPQEGPDVSEDVFQEVLKSVRIER